MSERHTSDELGEPAITLPPPLDNPLVDLLLLIVLILIAIGGGLKRAIAPKPAPVRTIRLGEPQFAPLSAQDEADAAHLLGSSLADLWAAAPETPQ